MSEMADMNAFTRTAVTAAGILLTIISGIALTRLGRPLNTGVFTVHKLIALGLFIFGGVLFFSFGFKPEVPVFQKVLFLIELALAITLFASGAVLSLVISLRSIFIAIHMAATILGGIIFILILVTFR